MNDQLWAMRRRALSDNAFRMALLATRDAEDPLAAFCDLATASGFPITPGEIISDGENSLATKPSPPTAETPCPTTASTTHTTCFSLPSHKRTVQEIVRLMG